MIFKGEVSLAHVQCPGFEDFVGKGKQEELNGNLELAIQLYRQALENNQNCLISLTCLAHALLRIGQISEAARLIDPVITRKTNNTNILLVAAKIKRLQGVFNKARIYTEKALHLCPDASVFKELASIDVAEKIPDSAITNYSKSIISRFGFFSNSDFQYDFKNSLGEFLENINVDKSCIDIFDQAIERELLTRTGHKYGFHFRDGNPLIPNNKLSIGFVFDSKVNSGFIKFLVTKLSDDKSVGGVYLYDIRTLPGSIRTIAKNHIVKGVAGTTTIQLYNLVLSDGPDVIIDLEAGTENSRNDTLVMNPTMLTVSWLPSCGEFSMKILSRINISTISNINEWQELEALSQPVVKKFNPEIISSLIKVLLRAKKIASNWPLSAYSGGRGEPIPFGHILNKRDAQQRHTHGWKTDMMSLQKWYDKQVRQGVSFTIESKKNNLKVAVVTVYNPSDSIEDIRQSHKSLLNQQNVSLEHIIVANGAPKKEIDELDVLHLILPEQVDTFGQSAWSIGSVVGVSRGAFAVAYLPVRTEFKPDHLQKMIHMSLAYDVDLCFAHNKITDSKNNTLRFNVYSGNMAIHCDAILSTFFLRKGALNLIRLWSVIPDGAWYYSTGLFRSALLAQHMKQQKSPSVTTVVKAKDAYAFQSGNISVPEDEDILPIRYREEALKNDTESTAFDWLILLLLMNGETSFDEQPAGVLFDAKGYLKANTINHNYDFGSDWVKKDIDYTNLFSVHINKDIPSDVFNTESFSFRSSLDAISTNKAFDGPVAFTAIFSSKKNHIKYGDGIVLRPVEGVLCELFIRGFIVKDWYKHNVSQDQDFCQYSFLIERI